MYPSLYKLMLYRTHWNCVLITKQQKQTSGTEFQRGVLHATCLTFRNIFDAYFCVLGMEERKGEPIEDPDRVDTPVEPCTTPVPSGLLSQSLGAGLTPTSFGGFTQEITEERKHAGLDALGE